MEAIRGANDSSRATRDYFRRTADIWSKRLRGGLGLATIHFSGPLRDDIGSICSNVCQSIASGRDSFCSSWRRMAWQLVPWIRRKKHPFARDEGRLPDGGRFTNEQFDAYRDVWRSLQSLRESGQLLWKMRPRQILIVSKRVSKRQHARSNRVEFFSQRKIGDICAG